MNKRETARYFWENRDYLWPLIGLWSLIGIVMLGIGYIAFHVFPAYHGLSSSSFELGVFVGLFYVGFMTMFLIFSGLVSMTFVSCHVERGVLTSHEDM